MGIATQKRRGNTDDVIYRIVLKCLLKYKKGLVDQDSETQKQVVVGKFAVLTVRFFSSGRLNGACEKLAETE